MICARIGNVEFQKLLKERHSIRVYQNKEIEEEKLEKILEAARNAPSSGNLQAYKICVVREKTEKEKIAVSAGQDFIARASAILVFCQDKFQSAQKYKERGEKLYSLQDATIACAYAQLTVADLGLGAVWVGAFDEKELSEILSLPPNLIPVSILSIGYPAEKPTSKPRRSLTELIWQK
jgi:nitroreductase